MLKTFAAAMHIENMFICSVEDKVHYDEHMISSITPS
jgi:hypothetical protein